MWPRVLLKRKLWSHRTPSEIRLCLNFQWLAWGRHMFCSKLCIWWWVIILNYFHILFCSFRVANHHKWEISQSHKLVSSFGWISLENDFFHFELFLSLLLDLCRYLTVGWTHVHLTLRYVSTTKLWRCLYSGSVVLKAKFGMSIFSCVCVIVFLTSVVCLPL